MTLAERYPPVFPPPWASAWGDDPYGLWAEFTVGEVVQRMRWIEPGKFLMGSPEREPQRNEDESPQHEVSISTGFWLADSACTQALWQAVLAQNPSEFKGDPTLPVESVSWNHVQSFLVALETRLPMSSPCLPTEAQWEYSCRAGTKTPFSFGKQITPAQVNYDGNHPYNNGAKGEYRKRTVPVKSLPPSAWGLYEMHGNVWEWCADGERKYDGQPQRDPVGPDGPHTLRALRGGSWFDFGRGARSAYRSAIVPGRASISFGFRLSLRSIQPSQSGAAGEARMGRVAERPPA